MRWLLAGFLIALGLWWRLDDTAWTNRDLAVVPLHPSNQALMVDAVLNNRVPCVFIVDTGATYTSISRSLAEQLGVDIGHADKVTITTANGRVKVPKVKLRRLMLNGIEGRNVEATVMDIQQDAAFSGLLGLSFMKQYRVTIDPGSHQLIFQQPTLAPDTETASL